MKKKDLNLKLTSGASSARSFASCLIPMMFCIGGGCVSYCKHCADRQQYTIRQPAVMLVVGKFVLNKIFI